MELAELRCALREFGQDSASCARLPMRKSSHTGRNQVLEEYCRHRGTQSKACQAKQQATQLHLRDHATTALPQRRPSLVKREPCAEALAYQERLLEVTVYCGKVRDQRGCLIATEHSL